MENDEDKQLPDVIPAPNKVGRPKGSKNKITVLKLMAEEAARARNSDRIQYVIDKIISEAAQGSIYAQKLVWSAVMSQGIPNEQKAAEKVQINIGRIEPELPVFKPAEVVDGEIIIQEEKEDESQAN